MEANTGASFESSTDLWTYRFPTSNIATVAPANGQDQTRVAIAGSDLFGGGTAVTGVTLAGAAATITAQNNTHVSVTAGANAAGSGAVSLISDTGATAVLDNSFTYVAAGRLRL
jgi:hypothetical protein